VTNLYARGSDLSADAPDGQSNPDLEARVDALENLLNQLREELQNALREMQEQLNMKLDYSQLQDLEKQLLDRLQEMVADLAKKFADRSETKKALKELNRQIKNLYDMM